MKIFLDEAEWRVLGKHPPQRPPNGERNLGDRCSVCGLPEFPGNPLHDAHRIPFEAGWREFAIRPEILQSRANLVRAHRRKCNDAAELGPEQIVWVLRHLYRVEALPPFVALELRQLWARETGSVPPEDLTPPKRAVPVLIVPDGLRELKVRRREPIPHNVPTGVTVTDPPERKFIGITVPRGLKSDTARKRRGR